MANRRTSWTNAFETTLASGMDPSTSTMLVQDASALAVPCYLVIEPDEPAQREYVYVASKAGNTLTVGERYLAGSGAPSGITHPSNATVRSVALAQGFTDLHDRIDSLDSTVATLPHSALAGLTVGDDHPQYLLRTDATTDYAPLVHTHEVADITDMNWSWSGLPGKPSTFAPSAHTHPWSEVTGKPSTFAPSAHTHTWSQITNPPATYTPSAHTHSAADITSGTLNNNRLNSNLGNRTIPTLYSTVVRSSGSGSAVMSLSQHEINVGQVKVVTSPIAWVYVSTPLSAQSLHASTAVLVGDTQSGLTYSPSTGGRVELRAGADGRVTLAQSSFTAALDGGNQLTLGYAERRWGTLYTTTNPSVSSDARLKHVYGGVGETLSALSVVDAITPRRYHLLADETKRQRYGWVAQEVRDVLPEVVHEDAEGMLSLAPDEMTAVLWQAVRELQATVRGLQDRSM